MAVKRHTSPTRKRGFQRTSADWPSTALAEPVAHGGTSMGRPMRNHLLFAAATFCLLVAAGCSEVRAAAPPAESWDVYYMDDAKVGHSHATRRDVEENGQKLQQVENTAQMTMSRLGQKVTIEMNILFVEQANGDIVRFESNVKMANMPMKSKGTVKDGKLTIEGQVLGRPVNTVVDCPAGTGGADVIERSLAGAPLKPGEKRELKMLMPMFNVVATVVLKAADFEETKLLEGKKARLLRIEGETIVPGQAPMLSTAWADDKGMILKSVERAGMMVTAYRTTKEVALREGNGKTPDLITLSIVKVTPQPRGPHSAAKVVYRATLKDGDPAKVFPAGRSQTVKSMGDHEAEITVQRVRPGDGQAADKAKQPTDDDRKPNVLIQSDDEKVIELANEVAKKETDPWKVAVALERHVRESMKSADFSQALASAAEVARTRRGDCTEHAVLLAAMARARGIPARVAVGLVYAAPLGGFAFHMWTEVWIKDRWIPLDGTLGKGGIGGGHLKLNDSNLADGSPTSFLTVYQVMGKLGLKVVSEE